MTQYEKEECSQKSLKHQDQVPVFSAPFECCCKGNTKEQQRTKPVAQINHL